MIEDAVVELIKESGAQKKEDQKKLNKILFKNETGVFLSSSEFNFLENLVEEYWCQNEHEHEYKKALLENASEQFGIYKEIAAEME